MISPATPRIPTLLSSSAATILLLGAASMYGCAPSDMGAIDMAKSKSIAAEKGLDARRGGRPVADSAKTKARVKRGTDLNTSPEVRGLPSRPN